MKMEGLREAFPDDGHKKLLNWQAQLWAFLRTISVGDLAILPLKASPAVAIGEVTGSYIYRPDLPSDARHASPVKWLATDLPRTAFGQDLLYSLGAFLTVCEVKRHEAVRRLDNLVQTGKDLGWTGPATSPAGTPRETDVTPSDEETSSVDIEGPDGGVDVLVGSGPLGMDAPRICVQVKSSSSAVDAGVVRELQGVVGRLKADQGLLVAWGGLTRAADREIRQQFFHVRVWEADEVLRELTAVYDRLPGNIQADLPLKRIWTLSEGDETR
jgi:restriction system protein